MKINKQSLQARVNNISNEKNIVANAVYMRFFFDSFLRRLAKSKYSKYFVLKGGLYLSSIYGVDLRSTLDVDFILKSKTLEKEWLTKVIKEISSINLNDDIVFNLISTKPIRQDDLYGGYRFQIEGKLENVRQIFSIDVATGDPIVPSEVHYDYECLITKDKINILAYSLYSVISEKLETFLSKGIQNSRSKDLYDLYILNKFESKNLKDNIAKKAFKATCYYRNFSVDKTEALTITKEVKDSVPIRERWNNFVTNSYAKGILFDSAIQSVLDLINIFIE